MAAADRYDAFLSYSQASDAALAPALQLAVERVGRPWHKPRARRLFRDKATLTPGPSLWDNLQKGLERSRWYVLLCSPESAASRWVGQELSWWLRHRGSDRLLLVVTGGELVISPSTGRIDPELTSCLPEFAAQLFDAEPLWVDLTWAKHAVPKDAALTARFHDVAADIAAAVSEVPKDSLVGENIRQGRRTRLLVRTVIAFLSVLVLLATGGGVLAVQQRDLAQAQLLQATSRQLVAAAAGIRDTQPDLARQLILTAYRQAPTAEALGAVLGSSIVAIGAAQQPTADAMAADPRRNLIALASAAGITFRTTEEAAVVGRIELSGSPGPLAYAADGSALAAVDDVGVLRLWSLDDPWAPQLLTEQAVVSGAGRGLAFLGESRRLAVADETGQLRVLDLSRPDRIEVLESIPPVGDSGGGPLLAASDGSRVVTCRGRLTVWAVSTSGRFRSAGEPDVGDCSNLDLSSDGYLLAVSVGEQTTLYDIADPQQPIRLAPLPGHVLGAGTPAFSPDKTSLAIGAGDGSIQLWNVRDPIRPRLTDRITGLGGSISAVTFSGASDALLAQLDDPVADIEERTSQLRLWPVRTGARSPQLGEIDSYGTQVGAGPDGRHTAAGWPPRLWSTTDRRQPVVSALIGGYRMGGQGMAIDHSGTRLVVGSPPVLYDIADPRHPRRLTPSPPAESEPSLLAFLPGDRTVVALDEGVALWDVTDAAAPKQLGAVTTTGVAKPQSVALSPDGRHLAVAGEAVTVIYDISDPEAAKPAYHLPTAGSSAVVAFVGGSDLLAHGDTNGIVHLWARRADLFEEVGSARRHSGPIGGIGAHPSQPWVATGGEDGSVRLWDVSDPSRPAELAVYPHGGIYSAASVWFTPDGRTLATSDSTSIRFWDVDLPGILAKLCSRSSDLTAAEWSAYLPQRPYDPPCQ